KPVPGKSVTLHGGGALPQPGSRITFTPRKWFNKATGKNGRIFFKFYPAPDVVMLDGQPISPPFDAPREVKPGSHQIVASSTELGVTESADVMVEPGEEYDVGLDLAVLGKH